MLNISTKLALKKRNRNANIQCKESCEAVAYEVAIKQPRTQPKLKNETHVLTYNTKNL